MFDLLRIAAGRIERRFVDDVRQISAHHSGRFCGDEFQIDVRADLQLAGVDSQNSLALLQIRAVEHDLPVETAGSEKRAIQHFGTVRCAHNDHGFRGVEAVHFDQQLIERLLALFIGWHRLRSSTAFPDSVELVNKYDAWGAPFGLLEEVTDARCAYADEHLDEKRLVVLGVGSLAM